MFAAADPCPYVRCDVVVGQFGSRGGIVAFKMFPRVKGLEPGVSWAYFVILGRLTGDDS